jgi:hypothetical protein
MRLGTLMFGGVLGAAAAVYFSRGGLMRSMMAQTAGNRDIGKFTEKTAGSLFANSGKSKGSRERTDGENKGNLDQIRDLLKDDPKVMAQVEEILSASGESIRPRVQH